MSPAALKYYQTARKHGAAPADAKRRALWFTSNWEASRNPCRAMVLWTPPLSLFSLAAQTPARATLNA